MSHLQEDLRAGHAGEAHWDLPKDADPEADHLRLIADATRGDRAGEVPAAPTADEHSGRPAQVAGQPSVATQAATCEYRAHVYMK